MTYIYANKRGMLYPAPLEFSPRTKNLDERQAVPGARQASSMRPLRDPNFFYPAVVNLRKLHVNF